MSSDGRLLAVSAYRYNYDEGSDYEDYGKTYVYEMDYENQTISLFSQLDGEGLDEEFGSSLTVSSNGLYLAASSKSDGEFTDEGSVRIYRLFNTKPVMFSKTYDVIENEEKSLKFLHQIH